MGQKMLLRHYQGKAESVFLIHSFLRENSTNGTFGLQEFGYNAADKNTIQGK
jgi:hypothetical protein